MNKADTLRQELEIQRRYHSTDSRIEHRPFGAVFLNVNNDLIHERGKLDVAYELKSLGHKVITEAQREGKIVDLVDCTDDTEIEVVHKHETDQEIKAYRENGVIVILVGETITCSKCNLKYPKRNEKGVCQNCLKGASA